MRWRCSTASSRSGASRRDAVVGFWPANSVGDDIELYADETRTGRAGTIHTLRQQMVKPPGPAEPRPGGLHRAARVPAWPTTSAAFAVTAGHGLDELVAEFEAAARRLLGDPGQALADRLAEAFAERLHELVRREFWGYAPDESLSNVDLIAERYQGIRPAPGYPACPDHTEKGPLFELLDAEARAGIILTESFAMLPGARRSAATTSGTREAAYFGLGRIGHDQLEDYARRKDMPVEVMPRAGWRRTSPRTDRRPRPAGPRRVRPRPTPGTVRRPRGTGPPPPACSDPGRDDVVRAQGRVSREPAGDTRPGCPQPIGRPGPPPPAAPRSGYRTVEPRP